MQYELPLKKIYVRGQTRTCKYCPLSAQRNITPTGRNKGWLRTCGSPACLRMQYDDERVNTSKCAAGIKQCELCSATYSFTSARQKWCAICAPDTQWRARVRRYGIGKPQWDALVAQQNDTCVLCFRPPAVVDHCHKTNRVRGLLCNACNVTLAKFDDDPAWIARALAYVGVT